MTQQEIQERNKQIALMLGLDPLNNPYLGAFTINDKKTYNSNFYHERLEGESWYVYPEYHSEWNWLMEAVEFIEKLGETNKSYGTLVEITTTYTKIGKITIDLKLISINKIEATFIAVSDFAKLYNEGKL